MRRCLHSVAGFAVLAAVVVPVFLSASAAAQCTPSACPVPTAETEGVTDLGVTSVTANGVVDGFGQVTEYFFQYGTTTEYGGGTAFQSESSASAVTVAAMIAGLAPDTTYHFRLVAENQGGAIHGADNTFTTAPAQCAPQAPTAGNEAATDVRATGAALNGVIDGSCGVTHYFFQYGTTTEYERGTAFQSESSASAVTVAAAIAGLAPDTTYHFRLVAENAGGETVAADRTFTTGIIRPIQRVHAPRRIKYGTRFRVTVGLATRSQVTISLLSRGLVVERLDEGSHTGTFRPRLKAPDRTGAYVFRIVARGGGTTQTLNKKITVF